MKKYLLSIGATLSLMAPIATVISCTKSDDKDKGGTTDGKDKGGTTDGKDKGGTTDGKDKGGTTDGKDKGGTTDGKDKGGTTDGKDKGVYKVLKSRLSRNKNYGLANYDDIGVTNSNVNNEKEDRTRKATGESFAPHFRPADIPNWEAKKETDGNYVRSRVPLAKRSFAQEKVTKTKGNGRYYAMDTLRQNTSNSLNKTSAFGSGNSQIIQGLQYMTDMIAFGGSVGEGVVYIPRAQDIDAYHRMGVKVHATIFFAPSAYGGTTQDYRDLMGEDKEKTADTLVKMAKYYGFDGWFINDENSPADGWIDFMKTWHKKAKKENIEISYYLNYNGGPVYDAGNEAYDIWFNDYSSGQGVNSKKGIKEQTSPKGYQTWDSNDTIAGNAGSSFWTYREWENGTYFKNEKYVRKFLNGASVLHPDASVSDPRKAGKGGMAYWYKEYTPFVEHKSYSTSFSKGEGQDYNFMGKKIEKTKLADGYASMALQDYLPTWKYIIDVAGADGKIDNTKIGETGITIKNEETKDAWMGSDALIYSGEIKKKNTIINKLFASEITIKDKDSFSMMYKGEAKPSLAVWTKEGEKDFKQNLIEGTLDTKKFANGYKKISFDISSLKGKVMTSFGTAFKNTTDKDKQLKFTLGKLAFNASDQKVQTSIKVDKMINDGEWLTATGKSIRLRWETKAQNIKEYLIYATDKEFKSKELIDISNTPAITLRNLAMEEKTNIIIVPINNFGQPLKEMHVAISGQKLDFTKDSNWHKTKASKTDKYGIETGHGFVGKLSDGEGGMYLINDQVSVMHFTNAGVLETKGNYEKNVFPGKSGDYKDRYDKDDGVTFGSAFLDSSGNIFISHRAGENGLFVFSKGMGKSDAKWDKFKKDKFIFTIKDEYIARMFQQKDGTLVLISSLGNIAIIDKDGKLTKLAGKNIIGADNKKEFEVSAFPIGDKMLITAIGLDTDTMKSVLIDSNNNIANTEFDFGKVLSSKKIGDKLYIVSVKSAKFSRRERNNLFLTLMNTKTNKVEFSQQLKNGDKNIAIRKNYFNTVVLSNDGKKIFMRDDKISARVQPWNPGYAQQSAYIMALNVSNITKDNAKVKEAKSMSTYHAEVNGKKYAGDYFNMFMLKNGNIGYSTSDWGRVGVIKVKEKEGKFDEAVLQNIYVIKYRFTVSKDKKIDMTSVETFIKSGKNLPVNPFKK